ncbi:MAG: septal ring lytic transglycosylase RlpA family protein [Proteobacteria bacterium]|nr:septal ring lytic transglycosylase RlpA family protein [Pseudomonadota bacterium]MBW3618211.1 septal ring lytic transglycosylase RlpA family protein [Pseudomonadota bacterium]
MARRILGRLLPVVLLGSSAAACASVEAPRPLVQAPVAPAAEAPATVRANLPIPNPPERSAGRSASDTGAVARARGGYRIGKPYQIAGVWYVPAEQPDYDAVGTASWYGDAFHGKPTANGEAFDMHMVSAAHATLPLPSIVEVTNLDNDRSIQVRVNDRGPFKPGRIIDVSRQAADQLGFVRQGTAKVRVRYVGRAPLDPFLPTPPEPAERAKPVLIAALAPKVERPREPKSRLEPALTPVLATPEPAAAPVLAVAAPSFAVQAGAFSNRGNAERAAKALSAIGPAQVRELQRDGALLYRVLVGAWAGKDSAAGALTAVAEAGFPDARVVSGS